MSSSKFSDEIKRHAVAQITERGYPVSEVAKRLGVSAYSLYAWKKKFAKASSGEVEKGWTCRAFVPPQVNRPGSVGDHQIK